MEYQTQSADWQWAITIDDHFIAGMAICPDDLSAEGHRGWFVAYAGKRLVSPWQIRPMFELFREYANDGPFTELRAWVVAGAQREERFAKAFGFALDCGPASGISPTGLDMNLWLWRRQWAI